MKTMLTRTQTKQMIQTLVFNIDFDEASNAWKENKIKQTRQKQQ
jgi:hypothetical protein